MNTSKTAAAAAAEFLVVRDNLDALLDGVTREQARYDGYSSCPLVTKKGEWGCSLRACLRQQLEVLQLEACHVLCFVLLAGGTKCQSKYSTADLTT